MMTVFFVMLVVCCDSKWTDCEWRGKWWGLMDLLGDFKDDLIKNNTHKSNSHLALPQNTSTFDQQEPRWKFKKKGRHTIYFHSCHIILSHSRHHQRSKQHTTSMRSIWSEELWKFEFYMFVTAKTREQQTDEKKTDRRWHLGTEKEHISVSPKRSRPNCFLIRTPAGTVSSIA